MNAKTSSLRVVAGLVEKHVPVYESGQWDPVIAAETGRGSCFSKNIFGAVLLKAIRDENLVTAVNWGDKQHPKSPSGFMLDISGFKPGHSSLLVGTKTNPGRIVSLSFNERTRRNDQWNTYDFNYPDEDRLMQLVGDSITPTQHGVDAGLHAYPWYIAGQKYAEALGIDDSVFHVMTEPEIEDIVLRNLKSDPIPREIPVL